MTPPLHLTLNDIAGLRIGCGNDACGASLLVRLDRERQVSQQCPGCGEFWSTYNNKPGLIQAVAEVLRRAKLGDPHGIGLEVVCKDNAQNPPDADQRFDAIDERLDAIEQVLQERLPKPEEPPEPQVQRFV